MPKTSPPASASNAVRASSIGTHDSITGRTSRSTHSRTSRSSSSRVPIVEPTTESCRKNTRFRPAGGSPPDVAPEITSVPPGFSDFSEWSHVAAPTVSATTSTRSGSRAPGSNAASAPSETARARLSSERDVAHTRSPAARPRTISAVATPPPAPCTRIVEPGTTAARVNSIRYAVSHAVGRQAASANDSSAGFGTRLRRGTATRSANVPA